MMTEYVVLGSLLVIMGAAQMWLRWGSWAKEQQQVDEALAKRRIDAAEDVDEDGQEDARPEATGFGSAHRCGCEAMEQVDRDLGTAGHRPWAVPCVVGDIQRVGCVADRDTDSQEPTVRHLYVHIPFCRSLCAYCDFSSEVLGPHVRAGRDQEYVARLRAELAHSAGQQPGGSGLYARLQTIYMGGGTPTVLAPELLLPLVRELAAGLEPGGEFTIEANPGTVDAAVSWRLWVKPGSHVCRLVYSPFAPRGAQRLGDGPVRAKWRPRWRPSWTQVGGNGTWTWCSASPG